MDNVRLGIIGVGGMGSFHLQYLLKKEVDRVTVTAIADADAARRDKIAQASGIAAFSDHRELMESKLVDAVLIATPHFQHPAIALDAFSRGLHVLCEKPVAVSVGAARQLNAEYQRKYSHLKFGIMYQMRTSPINLKMREMIADGELGEITRVTCIATNWFRTWAYYASGGWRATWAGEGGGVLLNQGPHGLDQLQWITGLMPSRVTAVAFIGKTHPIEVEDEVSAILEYPNGAIGHLIMSTGESPGTDRLEIAGDRGRLVCEGQKLVFYRNRKSAREVCQNSPEPFPNLETWQIDVPLRKTGPEGHIVVTQSFINAILRGDRLIADGVEGIRGLEIGNAVVMAGLTRKAVDLPLDADAYDQFIQEMIRNYGGRKNIPGGRDASVDMSASFH